MALVKISELAEALAFTGTEDYVFNQNGNTRRGNGSGLVGFIESPASGSAPDKDEDRIADTVDAVLALPKGGSVVVGSGIYNMGSYSFPLPEYSTGKSLNVIGGGRENTHLVTTTDSGAGTYVFQGDGPTYGLYFSTLRGFRLVGPGTASAPGAAVADMDGIRWDSRTNVEDVDIIGFRAGLVSSGNHSHITRGSVNGNYYGILFDNGGLAGDISIADVDLSGNAMASIGVAGGSNVATFHMFGGHLGFSPYGINFLTGASLAALAMGSTQFYGTSWEQLGNGAMYSEDQNAVVKGLVFSNCGNFTYGAPYKIASRGFDYMFKLGEMSGIRWTNTNFEGVPNTAFIDVTQNISGIYEDFFLTYYTMSTASKPFIRGPVLLDRSSVELKQGIFLDAIAAPCTTTNISAQQIVEWRGGTTNVQPHAGGLVAGVALNSVTAGGREYALVAQRGFDVIVNADDTSIAATDVLIPSPTDPTKVIGVPSTYPAATTALGGVYSGTGAGGIVHAHLSIGKVIASSSDTRLVPDTVYDPTPGAAITTTATTLTDADATNLSITFTVPANGKVRIVLSGLIASTGDYVEWGLRSGGSDIANSRARMGQTATQMVVRYSRVFTGLTPGNVLTWKWAHAVPTAGTSYLLAGKGVGTEYNEARMEARTA